MKQVTNLCLCLLFLGIGLAKSPAQMSGSSTALVPDPPPENSRSFFSCTQNIVDNGDFESFSFVSVTDCDDPNESCSQNDGFGCTSNTAPFQSCAYSWGDWWPSHGTPEIWHNGAGGFSAMLWSCRWNAEDGDLTPYGEGIFLNCYTFEQDKQYTLSFNMLVNDGPMDNVYIDLVHAYDMVVNYNISYTVDENYEIPYIPNKQTIYSGDGFSSTSWVNISFTFIPTSNYDVLWIHPYSSDARDGNEIPKVYIDDVCIQCTSYPNTVTYSTAALIPGWTYAHSLILGTNLAQVNSTETVTFRSGQEIRLEDDFTVLNGAKFLAYIDPIASCTPPNCATGNTLDGPPDQRSLDAESEKEIKIYPNPNNGLFKIDLSDLASEQSSEIRVYDFSGRLVFSHKTRSRTEEMNLRHLPKGIYLIHVRQGEQLYSERILIQ